MKKNVFTKILFLVLVSISLKAEPFFSVGLAKMDLEYRYDEDPKTKVFTSTASEEINCLVLEYGYDDKDHYRKYIFSNISSDYQSIVGMIEYAPRFNDFWKTFLFLIGSPSNFSIGTGLGYNNFKLAEKDQQFFSFNVNFNLMYEFDNYVLKIGSHFMLGELGEVKDTGFIESTTKYVILQYMF